MAYPRYGLRRVHLELLFDPGHDGLWMGDPDFSGGSLKRLWWPSARLAALCDPSRPRLLASFASAIGCQGVKGLAWVQQATPTCALRDGLLRSGAAKTPRQNPGGNPGSTAEGSLFCSMHQLAWQDHSFSLTHARYSKCGPRLGLLECAFHGSKLSGSHSFCCLTNLLL